MGFWAKLGNWVRTRKWEEPTKTTPTTTTKITRTTQVTRPETKEIQEIKEPDKFPITTKAPESPEKAEEPEQPQEPETDETKPSELPPEHLTEKGQEQAIKEFAKKKDTTILTKEEQARQRKLTEAQANKIANETIRKQRTITNKIKEQTT